MWSCRCFTSTADQRQQGTPRLLCSNRGDLRGYELSDALSQSLQWLWWREIELWFWGRKWTFFWIFNCFKNDQVQNSYQNIYETAKTKRVFVESAKVPFLLSSLCPPSASLVYGINGKCRLYVALQSHGRSLRRCSSVRTHPQRSPLGRCLGAPKWQMDFCKLPNQITRIILDERSNLTFTRSGATASSLHGLDNQSQLHDLWEPASDPRTTLWLGVGSQHIDLLL